MTSSLHLKSHISDLASFTSSLLPIQWVIRLLSRYIQHTQHSLISAWGAIRPILRYTSCYILLEHPQACRPASHNTAHSSKSPEGLLFITSFTTYREESPQCIRAASLRYDYDQNYPKHQSFPVFTVFVHLYSMVSSLFCCLCNWIQVSEKCLNKCRRLKFRFNMGVPTHSCSKYSSFITASLQ